MAKKNEISQESGIQLFDKTDMKWFINVEKQSVAFCNSISEILNGKVEQHEFMSKIVSSKIVIKKEETKEKNSYVIFILKNNNMIISRPWNELN